MTSDAERSLHWIYRFPYAVVDALMAYPVGPTEFHWKVCGDKQIPRRRFFASARELRQALIGEAPLVEAVHMAAWRRFLVFDVDLRENWAHLLEAPCGCEKKQAPEMACCPSCWRIASAAYQLVEWQMWRFAPEVGRPLCIFTGNNGVHLWYDVRRLRAGHPLRTRAGQLFFFELLGLAQHYPYGFRDRQAELLGLPLLRHRTVRFDSKVTVWPDTLSVEEGAFEDADQRLHGHMNRLPLSLHQKTGQVARPVTADPATGELSFPTPAAFSWDTAQGQIMTWLRQGSQQ